MKKINIAIDGPAGAGKSTVAKLVAKSLNYIYIDTGAMYRALTFKAIELGIDLNNQNLLNDYLKNHSIELINEGGFQRVEVDGINISDKIRTPEVSNNVSLVSSHPLVRKTMVEIQKNLAIDSNVVMDGRDIGTNVLPNAEIKIFLTASIGERARRRYTELLEKGYDANLENIKNEIALRDKKDQERLINPLKMADDAILLDTSSLTIGQVVEKILDTVKEKVGGKK